MVDEIMVAVAAALAGKAAEAAAEGARTAWGALVRLVRRRFADDQAAAAALGAAQAAPADKPATLDLARALERIAAEDGGFGTELRALWQRASAELSADAGGVVNISTGTVGGHLVQARDLHIEGGLHLGDVHDPGD
jgi:hypothetical protein